MNITDGPWQMSAPHPDTGEFVVTNYQGRVVARVANDVLATAIMALAQASQAGFIAQFLISALLEERGKLREQYADFERRSCQWCRMPMSPNNKARHEASCSKNPKNAPQG